MGTADDDEPDCGVAGCALVRGHRGRHMDAPAIDFNEREDARITRTVIACGWCGATGDPQSIAEHEESIHGEEPR